MQDYDPVTINLIMSIIIRKVLFYRPKHRRELLNQNNQAEPEMAEVKARLHCIDIPYYDLANVIKAIKKQQSNPAPPDYPPGAANKPKNGEDTTVEK